MKIVLPLEQINPEQTDLVGGKGAALARLARLGWALPETICITTEGYRQLLEAGGLRESVFMELGRKDFGEMRWEELWDASLRIRNLFLNAALPRALEDELVRAAERFAGRPVVVRSSAPGEDSPESSFAGLHESFVNVRGAESIVRAVRKVWASLWSDRALLYRRELGLDVARSSMAVLLQDLVDGERSGVVFSRSPLDPRRLVIEAVWGLNEGLVDGSVEPDHWELDRQTRAPLTHRAAARRSRMAPGKHGTRLVPLEESLQHRPPLEAGELREVATCALRLEERFGAPQDVEWTFRDGQLVPLQARPETALRESAPEDQRRWFLSLRRSFEDLQRLRRRIEEEVLPSMEADARAMAAVDLASLDDRQLAAEIGERRRRLARWEEVYRTDCIPMAHGIRLFGEFYNDAMVPEDPFAFVALLRGGGLRALQRNDRLTRLADALREGGDDPGPDWRAGVAELAVETGLATEQLSALLREMAGGQQRAATARSPERLEEDFLGSFVGEERQGAQAMLELARASYRLRDDDNISLGELRRQTQLAEAEGRQRVTSRPAAELADQLKEEGAAGFHRSTRRRKSQSEGGSGREGTVRVRQIQGQPACSGIASAVARVVRGAEELAAFRAGEILVCDAIDPTMTFVVPLAAAVVERRGGMLIHGAIIAREYGIPCVTGIRAAATIIRTGDRLTVDGFLGLVVISAGAPQQEAHP